MATQLPTAREKRRQLEETRLPAIKRVITEYIVNAVIMPVFVPFSDLPGWYDGDLYDVIACWLIASGYISVETEQKKQVQSDDRFGSGQPITTVVKGISISFVSLDD
jgi:hypothetical protein